MNCSVCKTPSTDSAGTTSQQASDFPATENVSPAGTTRGFGVAEFRDIGRMITEVLDGLSKNGEEGNAAVEAKIKAQATALCRKFPIYTA